MSERSLPTDIDFERLFPDADRRRLAQRLIDEVREISGIVEILGLVNQGSGVCDKLIFLAAGRNYEASTTRIKWLKSYETICPNILQRVLLNHPMIFTQEEWDEATTKELEGKRFLPVWQREQDEEVVS